MSSLRHHIAILFDPCILDGGSQTVQLKKASYQLQFNRNFLSLILESIAEYIRIIFDLHPSFITFDIISCGDKIHSQTSITKSDYIRTLERFSFINGIQNSSETKFVEAMERFLLELPSDFYNSHKYASPFNSHQIAPITHILFIARNQKGIKNYKYLIDDSDQENKQINFTLLCKTAKIRNHSIQKVYILKYDKSDENNDKNTWIKTTNTAYNSADCKQEDMIDFYESVITINNLHDTLLNLLSDIQFASTIRKLNIVCVPFKDPVTQIKTSLTIPMLCCIDNINHKHLYNTLYFNTYDNECNSAAEYNDILNLQWTKLPSDATDPFDWSNWITLNIVLITPSQLNDTSRLLMKFINKKKIATLRANYKTKNKYYIKCKYDNKLRITHCIKLIGMQLYLISLIYTKNIEGYNTTFNELRANNEYYLTKNKQFPFHEYCLQTFSLPNSAKKQVSHSFKHWLESKNISNSLTGIKPPFFNKNNKLNVMEMSETKTDVESKTNNEDDGKQQHVNNFARCKQYVSSSEISKISSQLQPNALQLIGKELTAKVISPTYNDNDIQNSVNHQNISLFDMFMQSDH